MIVEVILRYYIALLALIQCINAFIGVLFTLCRRITRTQSDIMHTKQSRMINRKKDRGLYMHDIDAIY